jgi:hypothetical protein
VEVFYPFKVISIIGQYGEIMPKGCHPNKEVHVTRQAARQA